MKSVRKLSFRNVLIIPQSASGKRTTATGSGKKSFLTVSNTGCLINEDFAATDCGITEPYVIYRYQSGSAKMETENNSSDNASFMLLSFAVRKRRSMIVNIPSGRTKKEIEASKREVFLLSRKNK